MIEWVIIKDWESDGNEPFFILTDSTNKKESIYIVDHAQLLKTCYPYILFYGEQITHAAKINFPVEKPLEEKFIHEFPNLGSYYGGDFIYAHLAIIAKQHYEGKK